MRRREDSSKPAPGRWARGGNDPSFGGLKGHSSGKEDLGEEKKESPRGRAELRKKGGITRGVTFFSRADLDRGHRPKGKKKNETAQI